MMYVEQEFTFNWMKYFDKQTNSNDNCKHVNPSKNSCSSIMKVTEKDEPCFIL